VKEKSQVGLVKKYKNVLISARCRRPTAGGLRFGYALGDKT